MNVVPVNQQQKASLTYDTQPQQEMTGITRYYQRSTTNKSFIEMSNYLKAIGIKNNRFMLTLLDKDLAGIDPHDPNLSSFYKMKVLTEVTNNFWYFLREVVRIPSSGAPSKFILNRGNMAFLYLAIMNINTILLMPRQTGKTIGAACFYVYVYNFKTKNSQISHVSKDFGLSKENLGRIRQIRDLLPSYLRFDSVFSMVNGKKTKVPNTVVFMEHAINHNKIRVYPKARNELAAANLLRGQTFPLLWADEFAFIPYMKTIYGNMAPAMSKAVEISKANGSPYGILYTTTPGFLTTDEGKYAYEIINNATKFNEGWYDLTYYQLMDLITSNKLSVFVYIEFTYQELGYSEDWFYEHCKEQNWDWVTIRREYLLEWSDESENNPFTKDELDTVKKFCKKPKKSFLIFGKYQLDIFEEIPLMSNLVPKYPPIVGVDPSGGVSKDSSCITFVDSRTTRVFAQLRSNTISLVELARVLEYIVMNMMPNAIINIERNGGYGLSVIGKLKGSKLKRNLYYEIKDKTIEESVEDGVIVTKKRKTKVYGLQSTKEVREQLIELLRERMTYHKDKFISPTIYKELTGLEVKKNGKVEHSDLTHDDQIFSYLMAMYVWYEGKNLRENFGIQKFGIKTEEAVDDVLELSSVDDVSDITEEIAYVNRDKQDEYEKQMAELQKGKGIMFSEFVANQRKKEDEQLKLMLQSPVVREAYAKRYGIKADTIAIDDKAYGPGVGQQVPNSVFLDFNKDDSELGDNSIYTDMNDYLTNNARQQIENELIRQREELQ